MQFEQVISALQSPNNEVRKQAEQLYNEALEKNSDSFIQSHFEMLKSQNENIRHYVLTILHVSLSKSIEPVLFDRLNQQIQATMFSTLIEIFKNETSLKVVSMLAEVLSIICISLSKKKVNVNPYFNTTIELTKSPNEALRFLGYTTVSQLILLLEPQTQVEATGTLVQLLSSGMNDNSLVVALAALDSFISCVLMYDDPDSPLGESQGKFIVLMPIALQLFGKIMNSGNLKLITKSLSTVAQFAYLPKEFMKPYVMVFVSGLLTISSNESIDFEVRMTAMSTVLDIVEPFKLLFKREPVALNNVLSHLFTWLCILNDDVDSWNKGEELDEDAADLARDLVDQSADMFGGECMFMFINSQKLDNWKKECAYLRWIYITLNAGKHFYKKHLDKLFEIINKYLLHQHPRVRNMAFLLLNEMICLFKKKCKSYVSQIFQVIKQSFSDAFIPNQISGCDIISSFIDVELVSQSEFQEVLMSMLQSLTNFITTAQSTKLIIAAFASLNFIIHFMKNMLDQYFAILMDFFKSKAQQLNQVILTATDQKQRKEILKIKSRLIEGLSMLVYSCSKSITKQVAHEIFLEVYNVFSLKEEEREVLMPFAEKAFTRLAGVLKDDIQPYLNTIVPIIISRASMNPEITVGDKEEQVDDEDWANTVFQGMNIGIKTSQIEEKADAISTLDLFVDDLQELMVPYVESMSPLIKSMKFIMDDTVRFKATTLVGTLFKLRLKVLVAQNRQQAIAAMKSSQFYVNAFTAFVKYIPSETEPSVALHKIETFNTMIKSLGPNALSLEELNMIFTMFADVFESYENSTKMKTQQQESVQGLTEEELEILDHSNETDSDTIMACQHLFQTVIKLNEQYVNPYNTILHQWIMKYYNSGNADYISTSIVYIGDLVTVGKRTDLVNDVISQFINYISSDNSDIQFNVLLSLTEILKYYPDNIIQNFFSLLAQKLKWCEQLRGQEKNDIYEASLLCKGSLLICHPELCKSVGINIIDMMNDWFGSIMNIKNVKDMALCLVIFASKKGSLIVDTPEKLAHYINFIGNTLIEDSIDEESSNMLKEVLMQFKQKFPDQVFTQIWQGMSIEAREEIYCLLDNSNQNA
ncbi:hypothetical protein ENUP19_0265G0058 [Entamoeba nuttalli]|uniref:Importin beta-3 family protein n=2 Tax=Entamoeba nuttalli TaxID=412467 RepID=K2HCJ5_ENTNP|nr:importin beta-3 family protein [Entamoeba nuttalli P19]EKE40464.1 importin beta-3 family protein [Entamoeba nuttalli P19]|eukprot:XP_008857199.1 importin beta-3 family protein [Entamoeba nuttalli P19]